MKDILVLKTCTDVYASKVAGGTISALAEIHEILEGSIAFFEKDATFITSTPGAGSIDSDQVFVALGRNTLYGTKKSVLIDRGSLNYEKSIYVAPVAEIKYAGFNGASGDLHFPGTLVAGDVAGILITDLSLPVEDSFRNRHYEYVIKTGDTADLATTGLVAVINADATCIATAVNISAAGDGFSLTHDTVGKRFGIKMYGILQDADWDEDGFINGGTVAGLSTPVVLGNGTYAQIADLELSYSPVDGNTSQAAPFASDTYKVPLMAVAGGTYTMYNLSWKYPNSRANVNSAELTQELIIAVPVGLTGHILALDNILAEL